MERSKFSSYPNDIPRAAIVTPIKEKTPSINFTMLNTLKNRKPISNEKGKQIRETESHIDTMVKNVEGSLQEKSVSSLEKIQ